MLSPIPSAQVSPESVVVCGIAGGAWLTEKHALSAETLKRMADVIRHRGPDDEGYHTSALRLDPTGDRPGVGLAFRRLSIIDLQGGNQPISNEDGSVWMVFNGEIYNYRKLRQRLEGSGHQFRSQSDSETIVHLYEDLGVDCFEHLNGMFAIAIFDAKRSRVVLARDRLGQKPLVYAKGDGSLLFASQIKSLLEVPSFHPSLDATAIDEYLTYQYVPHPKTIFRQIKKIPPGHYAVFENGDVSVASYWQFNPLLEEQFSEQDAGDAVREAIFDSVRLRMQSDVPLGAFLSGGVDSSVVVAAMQQQSTTPVKTFSIGFPVKQYDESDYARRMAKHLGTDHHELEVTPDAVEVLPQLIWHYDEPFADSSAIPTWYLSQLTREHVTVALSGDGGDELFLGYPRYQAVALANRLEQLPGLRSLLGSSLWSMLPGSGRQKSHWRRWLRFCEAFRLKPEQRYFDWISIFRQSQRGSLYHEDFVHRLQGADPFEFLNRNWRRIHTKRSAVATAALADLVTYLPCDLNTKVDTASMAHSLECRQPFLDHRLVQLAAKLPTALHFKRGGKRLLERAFGDLLPSWVWRRAKMGFAVPLDSWFRNELHELLNDHLRVADAKVNQFLHPEAIASLCDAHMAEQTDHSSRLWALLILEMWLRRWAPSVSFE